MNSKSRIVAIIAGVFVFAVGAARSAHAAPLQPCTLLTQAQVSKTLGTAILAGKLEGQFDCEWDQVGRTRLKGERVLLHVLGPMGNETPVQRFNTIKMPLPTFLPHAQEIIKAPVKGVGDDAVYMPASPLGQSSPSRRATLCFRSSFKDSRGTKSTQSRQWKRPWRWTFSPSFERHSHG